MPYTIQYKISGIRFGAAALLSIVMLSSCKKDFLDVVPVDRIPKEQFFKNEADMTAAIYGVYSAHKSLYMGSELALYNLEETRSDNTNQNFGRQAEHKAADNFTIQSGNTSVTGMWALAYNCINLCNAVVDRAPGATMDATKKAQIVGEAQFIRAQVYFLLLQDYGGVPLRIHETTSLSGDNNLVRSSPDSVYLQIISDLTAAATNLPASYTGADIGRATSYAAYALLGKVELQKGDNAAAVTALRKVVFPGTPYSLLPNYADIWTPGTKNSPESIFEIQFLPPLNGCMFWNYFAPASLIVPGGNNGSTSPNTPTQDLINAYEPGDKRLAASIDYDPNNVPYIKKFKDPGVAVGNDANTDFPILRFADAKLLLAEALGEGTEAYGLINDVRARAGLGPVSSATPGTFIQKVMHERQVELAFECHRWHDLLRMGEASAISIMNANLAHEFPGGNIKIDAHNLVAPIPNTETQTNTLAKQNPGYTN
ncbi:MAG TPA: RagB/SusD family nutrient uptake outer membrane protein [Puia sp.]|nr:RagB/SusD family nutrient uptake outer membrane protein [Puia sp.]